MQSSTETKRFKRGDVREDGRVFWQYNPRSPDGEYWLAREKFEARLQDVRAHYAEYCLENRERIRKREAEYRLENRERIRKRMAEYRTRPEVKALRSAYERARLRRKQDPLFAMKRRLRRRTHHAFARIGKSKPTESEELLGCSWEKAKAHIEKQFAPGMSWENRSEWHIDHVIPLASAYDEYTTMMLCHFTNLKPLWKRENASKNDAWYPPEYHI